MRHGNGTIKDLNFSDSHQMLLPANTAAVQRSTHRSRLSASGPNTVILSPDPISAVCERFHVAFMLHGAAGTAWKCPERRGIAWVSEVTQKRVINTGLQY